MSPSTITPRQVTDLGTSLQRRLSFAIATLTKEDATLLSECPHLFDEWALTWLRFRAHGIKVFVDCTSKQQEAVIYRILEVTPGVYTVNDQDRATLIIVDDDKQLRYYLNDETPLVDAFLVYIGTFQAPPWVLRTVAPGDIENGISAFFEWLQNALPDPIRK